VTPHKVLAIGLDGFEVSYMERLMAAGELPALLALRARSATVLLDHGPAQRTGLAWEHFWSGRSPAAAGRESAVEFDPARYTVWQEGARFAPFFGSLGVDAVVFDPPYADLARAPGVGGVVAWGAHDPGVGPGSAPADLYARLVSRIGAYPAAAWTYGTPWSSADATRAMAVALTEAVERRAAAARWLLTDASPDWDLGIVVVAEPHSAAEGFWHGIDPGHPLHGHPSSPAAADGMAAVYRAVDGLVGALVGATEPRATVVFSLGGMGSNHSDVASMALLPELLLRWSLGERLLEVPAAWAAEPGRVPLATGGDARWQRAWYPRLGPEARRRSAPPLVRALPGPVKRSLQRARTAWRGRRPLPTGYHALDWQPASWYRPWWPRMRAFALPSFYDGRVRVNLQGRERDGVVDPADYARVCDEIEELVRDCRDPRTGEPVVADVERCAGSADPCTLGSSASDLVVVWNAGAVALDHPVHGVVGPLPYRRTGGHTGPFGFAFVDSPDVAPGDLGVASSFDVAPTLVELVAARAVAGISGSALPLALRR
jgi:predicted AlkP superfamily phosphohydrolase/phosphomutase